MSHLGGFVAGVILPAFLGARSVIMPGWRPDEAVELIEAEQASLAMGATVFLSDLVQRYEAGAAQKHRLTLYACAGATLPPSLVLRAEAAGVRAMRCYGMTETAGVCAAAPPDAPVGRRSQWDGQVLAGMEIQAVTPDRVPLPPGEEGELRIRGPQLLTAYTEPERTREQLDGDGWFYRRLDRPDARHGMARPGRADRAPGGGPARPAEAPPDSSAGLAFTRSRWPTSLPPSG